MKIPMLYRPTITTQLTNSTSVHPVPLGHCTRNLSRNLSKQCPSYLHKKPVQAVSMLYPHKKPVQAVSKLPAQKTCPSSVQVTHTRNLSKQCPCYPHKNLSKQCPSYPHKKPVQTVSKLPAQETCPSSVQVTRQDSMFPCILQPSPQVVSAGRKS